MNNVQMNSGRGRSAPVRGQSAASAFGNRNFPDMISNKKREQVSNAITALLNDPRAASLLRKHPITVGRNVSVTSQERDLYSFLSGWRNQQNVSSIAPTEALFSLVGGSGETGGMLQKDAKSLLGGYSQDVISSLAAIRNQVLREGGTFSPNMRNQELCRADF